MTRRSLISILLLLALAAHVEGEKKQQRLFLDHADQFEVVLTDDNYVTWVTGNVVFTTETGNIRCDSARWVKGENARLNGHVVIDEEEYRIRSDSAFYDVQTEEALALGSRVELWSYDDSLFAVGEHAFYSRRDEYFIMEKRPVLYINYPDSARMIEVIADEIEHDARSGNAQAIGDVTISSDEFSSHSGCAMVNTDTDQLDLFEEPAARRGQSEITGKLISVYYDSQNIRQIDIIDSAHAVFKEPIDTTETDFDESILSGRRIIMNFVQGEIDNVLCYGQAYSWYYPSPRGGTQIDENTASGDTIRFDIDQEQLKVVYIIGGAVGRYLTGDLKMVDSLVVRQVDTVDYFGHYIEYDLVDSLITLRQAARVESGAVSLGAQEVLFDTKEKTVEAYSAFAGKDTTTSPYDVSADLQPNTIPVILRDRNEEVYGDYLLYSIDTEKGRIIQSKSNYETGFYYGKKLYREQKDIFYVDQGRYTTCDADEPHFHFYSSNMKLIEGDKLIARPVVFYVERIPVFALPYYVFPLKRGRHSGFLPFTFGQFEQGNRYVKGVGYYWAASEYWDWRGSVDYYETARTLTFKSRVNFKQRYVLDGYLTGDYTRETGFNSVVAEETTEPRWAIKSAYNHNITPSLSIKASGDFQSDKSYYSDYSQNLVERINRNTKSQLSFTKKFGTSASLSGNFVHDVDLDRETRTDQMPNLNLSLPTLWPFGSGQKNEQGQLEQKWYQKITFRYSPGMNNYSSRITVDSVFEVGVDTTITYDSITMLYDTTITVLEDTVSYRSRKKYTKINHSPALNLPNIKLGSYLNIIPRFSYSETWIKVYETDQSLAADVDAGTTYRTYSYSPSVSANTQLYGTVYPNMYGLVGLRHVVTPSVSYSYSPEINRHPEVRSFVGGGAGSSERSAISVSLNQLIQAKYLKNDIPVNKDLLSIRSGFSYNFLEDDTPYSNLSTSLQSSALPLISSLSASMTHSLYDPDTQELDFWSPALLSFRLNARLSLGGQNFFFDDPQDPMPFGTDSASQLSPTVPRPSGSSGRGWNFSADYSYSESGRGSSWYKSSFINFSLNFNLTPTTSIRYTQRYSFDRKKTISNSVNIVRKIHCWTGSLYWVPVGSNRGFGFKLYVTALPEIKIDNNYAGFTRTLQQ